MSAPRDLDRMIQSFLAEGPMELPDPSYDEVRDRMEQKRQRVFFDPWRTPDMSKIVGFSLAAAAVVVAVLIGIQLLASPSVGPSGPTPTPTPQQGEPITLLGTSALEPGTYAIGSWFPVQFDLAITDNWETWGAGNKINRIWKPCKPAECAGYSAILTFEIVDNTFADPCDLTVGPPIGDGVDDLVNALTGLPGFEAGPVTDISVDGYPGKSFELTFIGSPGPSCESTGTFQWMSGEDAVEWGTEVVNQRVIVLNVDGTRLVVAEVVYSGDRREMDAIVDSIHFN